MKTKSGKREINPTDAFRKEQRKKEIKKNKKTRTLVREHILLHKDLQALRDKIDELDAQVCLLQASSV